jgi:hypothetical protein
MLTVKWNCQSTSMCLPAISSTEQLHNTQYVSASHQLNRTTAQHTVQSGHNYCILGAFTFSQKGGLPSSRLSVCPSDRMYHFGSHWTDLRETVYWKLELKSVGESKCGYNWAKCRAPYIKTRVRCIVTADTKALSLCEMVSGC